MHDLRLKQKKETSLRLPLFDPAHSPEEIPPARCASFQTYLSVYVCMQLCLEKEAQLYVSVV